MLPTQTNGRLSSASSGSSADEGGRGRNSKTLILCFDGTNDQYGPQNTNVIKFYGFLKKSDFTEQMAYYQAGIGTWYNPGVVSPALTWLAKWMDIAFAWYLDAHVIDGYRFLMQNYRAGDRICLFGFSRGAYTARALAGFLHKLGLLSRDNQEQIPFAYKIYKAETKESDELARGFKETFCQEVSIDFLGVWDTVSSVGVVLSRTLPYTNSNKSVKVFRHALSLDERRIRYQPNLYHSSLSQWHERIDSEETIIESAQVGPVPASKEVWFSGCHSDVGGGNVDNSTEHSLANISLRWMIKEIIEAKIPIQFDPVELERAGLSVGVQAQEGESASYPGLADALSPLYDQLVRNKIWWILEVLPMNVLWEDFQNRWHSYWTINLGRGRKVRLEHPQFHYTVRQRIEHYTPRYAPKARYTAGTEEYVS
ncbi:hypothetical protein AX16_004559 [Volvariella volvacea WC 439]|nr:hypothetical protein AX16_004559 [Volvariella volvacea WC 439]